MSSIEDRLKLQVAELLGVAPESITPGTSLDLPRFRSSAGSFILQSAVRSVTGERPSVIGVRTFADLLSRASGGGAVNGAATPATPAVSPQPTAGASSGRLQPVGFGCGVDIEEISTMPECLDYWVHDFYAAHFSSEEIAYCVSQADPRSHFAARWCAKEALQKSATRLSRPRSGRHSGRAACHRRSELAGATRRQLGRYSRGPQSLPLRALGDRHGARPLGATAIRPRGPHDRDRCDQAAQHDRFRLRAVGATSVAVSAALGPVICEFILPFGNLDKFSVSCSMLGWCPAPTADQPRRRSQ